MPLPPAQKRTHLHGRNVQFRGYSREDGLWDIEGQVTDVKTTVFVVEGERTWQPGEPIHGMSIRVTIDDHLVVQDVAVAMDHIPHPECPMAMDPMKTMIGCSMAAGWRKAIETNLGNVKGCAHLRELLLNMGTIAFQTLPHVLSSGDPNRPALPTGNCVAWDSDGTMIARLHPTFVGWRPDGSHLTKGAKDKAK